MSDIQFIPGLIVKAPNPKAPEFVKASLSIKREDLMDWLASQSGEWINADIKEAKSGKWYCAINDYKRDDSQAKPQRQESRKPEPAGDGFQDDDLPF